MDLKKIMRHLLPLYLIGAVSLHVAAWFIYGGFSRSDHPPLWDVEEFFAVAGLKFTIFGVITLALLWLVKRWRSSFALSYGIQFVLLLIFVLSAAVVEDLLLPVFGWTTIFGWRGQIIMHLLAGLFGLLQIVGIALILSEEQRKTAGELAPLTQVDLPEKVMAKRGGYQYALDPSQIERAEAFGNFTRLFLGEEMYLYSGGIGKVSELLGKTDFLRIHRSHLIRTNEVAKIRKKGKTITIVLRNGVELPVGAKQRDAVLTIVLSEA